MTEGAIGESPKFTVVTTSFNRAHTLPRVYESLRQQTFRDFEWLVVDDGSTDGTGDLIKQWTNDASFPIRYRYQQNSGKAVGDNVAASLAHGELLANLDSDDWYVPTALETFATTWESIEFEKRGHFVGVVALCSDPSGQIAGDRFPRDVLDTDFTELRGRYRVEGDKTGCSRLDVIRKFPHPVFEGERQRIFSSIVLRRIAREYRCRCVNQVVAIVDYQVDGMSAGGSRLWVSSPRSAKLAVLEALRDDDLSVRGRLENYAHHIRFSLHARRVREALADSPSKLLALATAPVGFALYSRDRWRTWAEMRSSRAH